MDFFSSMITILWLLSASYYSDLQFSCPTTHSIGWFLILHTSLCIFPCHEVFYFVLFLFIICFWIFVIFLYVNLSPLVYNCWFINFFIVLLIIFLTSQQGGSQQCGILSLIWVCTKITCAADHSTVSFKSSVFGHIPPLTVFIYTTFELSGYTIKENCNDWKKNLFKSKWLYTFRDSFVHWHLRLQNHPRPTKKWKITDIESDIYLARITLV